MLTEVGNITQYVDELYKAYGNDYMEFANNCYKNHMLEINSKKKVKTIAMFYYKYGNGGVERVMSLLVPMYIELGYKVVLLTEQSQSEDDYLLPPQVKRYVICKTSNVVDGNIEYKVRAGQICEIIEKEEVDLLSYHASTSPLLFWDMFTAKMCGAYCIVTKHELFSQENTYFYSYTNEHANIFRLFDKVIVLSETEKQFWNIYGVDAEYIYNPVDETIIPDIVESREDIVWVGRFDMKQKRYLDVVPIMKEVVKKYPKIRLVMYGKGSSVHNNILQKDIIDNNLENNIILAGYSTSIADIYKRARIHLVTSAYESFSMVIYESKACGIPLVVYDMPYLELLKDSKGYIPVRYSGYKEATDAIINILDDEQLEKRLSQEALDSVAQYSMDDLKKQWQKVIADVEAGVSYGQEDSDTNYLKIILKTLNKHCDILIGKHLNLREWYETNMMEKLVDYIKKNKPNASAVVYPYGKVGRRVVDYLRENNINVDYAVDNGDASCDIEVIKVTELRNRDCKNNIFVICNYNPNVYDEIRRSIREYVDEEQIYDMYPEEEMERLIREEEII